MKKEKEEEDEVPTYGYRGLDQKDRPDQAYAIWQEQWIHGCNACHATSCALAHAHFWARASERQSHDCHEPVSVHRISNSTSRLAGGPQMWDSRKGIVDIPSPGGRLFEAIPAEDLLDKDWITLVQAGHPIHGIHPSTHFHSFIASKLHRWYHLHAQGISCFRSPVAKQQHPLTHSLAVSDVAHMDSIHVRTGRACPHSFIHIGPDTGHPHLPPPSPMLLSRLLPFSHPHPHPHPSIHHHHHHHSHHARVCIACPMLASASACLPHSKHGASNWALAGMWACLQNLPKHHPIHCSAARIVYPVA